MLPTSAFAQTSVTTYHNDAARTGANLNETLLTTTNVNVSEFGKLFERAVDDEIYAQPLYVEGVNIPVRGIRNVVYVATNSNTVYAFDADDATASAPLWSVNYMPAGAVPVVKTDVGQACGTYNDFAGNIGIGGTPTIDQAAQTIYFVTRTKEAGLFVQRLHAVDIRDGSQKPGSPLVIQASVSGSGDGRDAQNNIAFNPRTHNQRAALLLDHGTVYIAWASYCDQGPYHGWILGYDAATLQQVMVFNASPDGGLGGFWHSGGGLAADAAGNLYGLTGNGSFNGSTAGGRNFGNSFLKVSPTGALLDWFTPYNWSFLNGIDADLGIQNAMLVPNTNLIVAGGKEGVMYVLDRNNMGHFRSGNNGQIVQSFQGSSSGRMNGSPVYWSSAAYGPAIYVWAAGDPLKVFRLVGGLFATPASAQSTSLAPGGMPGGMLALSANGGTADTGILWAALSRGGDANHAPQPGILRAYDAGNVTRELWNSQQNAARDSLGNFSKFSPPTVANGKVFVPSLSNKLVVYGRIGPSGGNTAPVVNAGTDQRSLPDTLDLAGTVIDDGNPVPPAQVMTTWSLAGGPATVTFSAPNALSTTATFTVPGAYTIRLSAFDGQVTTSDDVLVTIDAPAGSGTGLLAQYFNDAGSGTYFIALALTRTDPTVDFDWADASPDPVVQADNFSVRWSGQVKPPITGSYTFTTSSDDGVRLYVNGQLLVDNWTDHGVVQNSGSIALTAGLNYDIRMDYYEKAMLATARLSWAYPGQNTQIVPQWALYPALPVNQPPAVSAGTDRVITLPAVASLGGIAVDDGLPTPPAMTTTWSKISGREDSSGGTVVFGNANAPATTATFGADGIYVLRLTVSDGAVTVSDDVTITVNPAAVMGSGTGLVGDYFNDPNNGSHFVTAVRGRLDATVNFNWASASPVAGVSIDNFSVRWTGKVQPPVSGNYTFTTTADDGVRLWVNGQLLIDNWVDQAATTRTSVPVALAAGALYDLKLEYFEHGGLATVRLLWAYPGQAQAAIPQSQLYPPPNRAPSVNAGIDRTVTLPGTVTLAGVATDDGLPSPPGQLSTGWTRVSGPGTVTFANASALNTTASFQLAGTYVLRLSASDSAFTPTDDVTIVVNASASGLRGQYYNDPGNGTHFATLVATRVDSTVNFNWGTAAPISGASADNFSVRWTGRVEAPVTGSYPFHDGVLPTASGCG